PCGASPYRQSALPRGVRPKRKPRASASGTLGTPPRPFHRKRSQIPGGAPRHSHVRKSARCKADPKRRIDRRWLAHQTTNKVEVPCVATTDTMLTQYPDVAKPGPGGRRHPRNDLI